MVFHGPVNTPCNDSRKYVITLYLQIWRSEYSWYQLHKCKHVYKVNLIYIVSENQLTFCLIWQWKFTSWNPRLSWTIPQTVHGPIWDWGDKWERDTFILSLIFSASYLALVRLCVIFYCTDNILCNSFKTIKNAHSILEEFCILKQIRVHSCC